MYNFWVKINKYHKYKFTPSKLVPFWGKLYRLAVKCTISAGYSIWVKCTMFWTEWKKQLCTVIYNGTTWGVLLGKWFLKNVRHFPRPHYCYFIIYDYDRESSAQKFYKMTYF
jgi:hypothetical protein